MRYLFALIIGIVGALTILFLSGEIVFAAQGECYGFSASTHETSSPPSTQNKFAQQWTPAQDISITAVAVNIYGHAGDGGDFIFQIQGTTAGLPDGVTEAGTLVNKTAATVPPGSVGTTQEFDCDLIPSEQIFTFAAPVSLDGGTMYALMIYHSSPGIYPSVIGWRQLDTGVAPLQGMICTGAPCVTDTGWGLTTSGGANYDIVYSIYDQFVDPAGTGNKKIDDHIFTLREYLRLGGEGGGLIFGLAIVGIVFAVALRFEIPFPVAAMFNAVLIGALARAEILSPWLLLAGIAVAGFAIVFRLANSGGGTTDES